jgi:hypothetical protein
MLLVPMATGALVGSQSGMHDASLAFFLVAGLSLFWLRTPIEAWFGTTAIKAHSPHERRTVIRVAACLIGIAAAAISWLFFAGYGYGLIVIGAVAVLAFIAQALVKKVGRRGRMPAQMIGALGLTATSAGAYYVCSARMDRVALALWLANWFFAAVQVYFVQVRIHNSRAAGLSEKLQQAGLLLLAQLLVLAALFACIRLNFFSYLVILAFVPYFVRTLVWFLSGPQPLHVHRLGFSELGQALLFGTLLSAAFLL